MDHKVTVYSGSAEGGQWGDGPGHPSQGAPKVNFTKIQFY